MVPFDGTAETGIDTLHAQPGDPGTLWSDVPTMNWATYPAPTGSSLGVGIGKGDSATYNNSPYYYTFLINIYPGMRTKEYKFEIEVDYVRP